MDKANKIRLEQNIFPAAHQACEPWEKFPWQASAHLAHSSQALAIDVFGTIKASDSRDAIVDAFAKIIGLPIGGPWDITLEWTARPSLLNEPYPTQVNVYAESPHSIILFECNFTEQDGGACSQMLLRDSAQRCDGNYGQNPPHQSDMVSPCLLSENGIQYWDIIPKVFHLDAQTDYQPCPFSGSAFQWMRNLVVAYKGGRQKNKQPAVVMVYLDHPGLPLTQNGRSRDWAAFSKTVRKDHVFLHTLSYQEILTLTKELTRQCNEEQTVWRELTEWVERKMLRFKSERRKPKRKKSSFSRMMAANKASEGKRVGSRAR